MAILPLGQLRWIINRLHVSATDQDVVNEIHQRMPLTRFTQNQIDEAVIYALAVHHDNQSLYYAVQTGSFND